MYNHEIKKGTSFSVTAHVADVEDGGREICIIRIVQEKNPRKHMPVSKKWYKVHVRFTTRACTLTQYLQKKRTSFSTKQATNIAWTIDLDK